MKILKTSSGRNPQYLNDYESYTHKECSKCGILKPVSDFAKGIQNNRIGWSYRSYCKDCGNKKTREYASTNKTKRNERLKKYRKNNPERMKVIDRKKLLKRKYGITLEEYNRMYAEQAGKCFICHNKKKLVVDHCHKTGEVRKLLCHECNTILGKIEKGEFDIFKNYIDKCHADILLKYANK